MAKMENLPGKKAQLEGVCPSLATEVGNCCCVVAEK
jgi:hypothetical protein